MPGLAGARHLSIAAANLRAGVAKRADAENGLRSPATPESVPRAHPLTRLPGDCDRSPPAAETWDPAPAPARAREHRSEPQPRSPLESVPASERNGLAARARSPSPGRHDR